MLALTILWCVFVAFLAGALLVSVSLCRFLAFPDSLGAIIVLGETVSFFSGICTPLHWRTTFKDALDDTLHELELWNVPIFFLF